MVDWAGDQVAVLPGTMNYFHFQVIACISSILWGNTFPASCPYSSLPSFRYTRQRASRPLRPWCAVAIFLMELHCYVGCPPGPFQSDTTPSTRRCWGIRCPATLYPGPIAGCRAVDAPDSPSLLHEQKLRGRSTAFLVHRPARTPPSFL